MDWITDGLDCWSGLIDWITGLNLFMLHDLHPIKCHKFGYSKHISSSHCMLGNVHECTMHKLHGRMCIINSWCTRSEFKAPSDYSEHAKSIKNTDKGLFTTKTNVLMECHGVRWCQMLYWLVVLDYCANWPTKLLHLLQYTYTLKVSQVQNFRSSCMSCPLFLGNLLATKH